MTVECPDLRLLGYIYILLDCRRYNALAQVVSRKRQERGKKQSLTSKKHTK